ncbi:MAG: 16S rRNA (adenine(1518)-N(6)/adenine(1519)-N(6))-dimethyltransferase RsmA [Hyphomonadaceae bacterium]|nr:16S rRNA (adenine(1518)-N(6)/adenine(1519)-N(6))-dimethyltransferase RsmA [Hyphomonadaceae bacterium]
MDEIPPLSQAPARKALGQHFLFDPDILHRTATAAGSPEGRTVIEIGPGPGGLTRALLAAGTEKLIVVEADPRFAAALRDWPEMTSGRLVVIEGDARKVDLAEELAQVGAALPAMIVANLPYNVGTPLLVDWLKANDWRGEMALMFQKEVAQRICAAPGSTHYGRLAVLSQAVCACHIAFTLPPGAFRPPPKVDSAVAVLRPLPAEDCFEDLTSLEAVTAAAFGQRRKMLRASLKSLAKTRGLSAEAWLEGASIDPTARAETIDQAGFRRLALHWANSGG